jgi:hypothetical protein
MLWEGEGSLNEKPAEVGGWILLAISVNQNVLDASVRECARHRTGLWRTWQIRVPSHPRVMTKIT